MMHIRSAPFRLTSAGYPPDSVPNLQVNTLWDGVFHLSTYLFVLVGLLLLWRAAHRRHVHWPGKLLAGTLLMGFGLFHVVEGIIDHYLLGLHYVNETVPPAQWLYWDMAFLLWGALMLVGGWVDARKRPWLADIASHGGAAEGCLIYRAGHLASFLWDRPPQTVMLPGFS